MTTNNPNEKICLGIVTGTYSDAWFGTYTIGAANTAMVTDVIATVDMYTDPRVLPISTGDNPRTLLNNYYYGGVGGLGQPGIGTYGIYNPTNWTEVQTAQSNSNTSTTQGGHLPVPNVQQWGPTNPYGVVVVDNYMYLLANDSHPVNRTCSIFKYDMINDTFTQVGAAYTFNPDILGDPTQWKGAGYGLDLYCDEDYNYYLIAVFARFTNAGWSYTFGPSAIVKINLSDGTATMANVNANVNGVVVNGGYAFVTSFGGAQVPLGNAGSKLEIFNISGAAPVLEKTITTTMVDNLVNPTRQPTYTEAVDPSQDFKGDFLDLAINKVNGIDKICLLLAHYNADYTAYIYLLICVKLSELMQENLANAAYKKSEDITPPSPCFALLPGKENNLYFVDGVHINKIDVTKEISATGAITPLKEASDFTNGALVGGLINTAAVVMERTVPVPAMRMAAGAVKASVTKIAKRLARPDELERKE